jgi:RNA polymerase sigma factor (sigma-70 family)
VDYSTISAEELALTCFRTGDELAWAEFVRRFHPLIARVALRVARQWSESSTQVVDDLVQNTYLKLCAERTHLLQNFTSVHKDAIYGYIKVFTANLAHDHFKASRSEKRGGSALPTSTDNDDPGPSARGSNSAEALIERGVLIQQIDVCLKMVSSGASSERDRRIFWLYYRVGLAASAIAALPTIGLSTKGVESTLLRLTRQVRQRLAGGWPTEPGGEKSGEGIRRPRSL